MSIVESFSVWIVGSSIIRDAHVHAAWRPDGINLGLDKFGGKIIWDFQGGMRIQHLKEHIEHLLVFHPSPKYLVVHCGGNDICAYNYTMVSAIVEFKHLVKFIEETMPDTRLVWSQVLPRVSWRNQPDNFIANKTRKRLNSCLSSFVLNHGGAYIRYPDIVEDGPFFKYDDTHLATLGNEILLNSLSAGISYFLEGKGSVYPI